MTETVCPCCSKEYAGAAMDHFFHWKTCERCSDNLARENPAWQKCKKCARKLRYNPA